GALIRHYTKWDDQPASVGAAQEAILRANQIAQTAPKGPVYINLDVSLQEDPIGELPAMPPMARYAPPLPAVPSPESIRQAAEMLVNAKAPVLLMGRFSRSEEGWKQRVALAEQLGARVLTSLKALAAFPTDHPLHAAPPGMLVSPSVCETIASADVIVNFD